MATTLMSEPAAPAFTLAPLPFSLDLACPLPLPSKAATTPWPFPVAGPSTTPDETLDSYVTRRYYEAVYLGELLAPLAGLVADWQRAAANEGFADVAARLIVPLAAVEERHRRTLAPVVAAVLSSGNTPAGKARIDTAAEATGLGEAERGALETGVGLRANSRVVVDGARGLAQRIVSQEFEMREVMLQLILLLMYRAARPESIEPKKKRKKASPTEDTGAALVHLTDRISLWLAMSELDIEGGKGKARADTGPPGAVAGLWAMLTTFLPREATFLTAFHLKVFGKEIPPELVPQKKRRKPEITHRLPRRASPVSTASATSAPMGRSSSRASVGSPPRSLLDLPPEPKRARQFQARPAPKLKRAHSMATRKEAKAPELARDASGGLMGRTLARSLSSIPTTSRTLSRTLSQSQSQSQTQRRLAKTQSETFVSATPIKANPFRRAVHHPTPIREEPSSAERSVRSFVAETPVANRINTSPYVGETPRAPALVAETPVARRHGPAFVAETPSAQRMSSIAETPGGDSDDDLAGLMVPTDDEGSD